MLRIWLFGSLAIANDDDERDQVAVAIAGRCGSLLAYLALGQGRFFSRAELLSNLWPEGSVSTTNGSFNTALWRLRRLVERSPLKHGDLIVCDSRGAVGLNGPVRVWLDVDEFERLVAPGLAQPLERLSDADVDGLRRGVALYKSDILLDLADDWALREREKHRRTYLNALWRLMQVATIRREYAQGIGYAQAILDSDGLREDVHRELMRLFVLNGQRAQALRQFECCRELLRHELAIQPMKETLAMYQRIAESAIGAVIDQTPVIQDPHVADFALQGMLARPPLPSSENEAHYLIQGARRNLALADSQLQLSLQKIAR
jgi:DNA-binding SARP family transcriptional activator